MRNGHITKEEGLALIKKFDGEFPDIYLDEVLEYVDIKRDEFDKLVDKFRPDHLVKLIMNGN